MDNKINSKKIETPTLIIKDDILKSEDFVVQISNISKCEIAPEPKRSYPGWAFIGIILGIGLTSIKLLWAGMILLAICCVVLFIIWGMNTELGTYLVLELNSGSVVLFSCRKKNLMISYKAQPNHLSPFYRSK